MRNSKQVRELTGVSQKTLRHWDERGVLSPARAESGYRYYSNEDLIKLFEIRVLQGLGYSLGEISARLNDGAGTTADFIDGQIAELTQAKDRIDDQINALKCIKASVGDDGHVDTNAFVSFLIKNTEYSWIIEVVGEGSASTEELNSTRSAISYAADAIERMGDIFRRVNNTGYAEEDAFEDLLSIIDEASKRMGFSAKALELIVLLSAFRAMGESPDSDDVQDLFGYYLKEIEEETGGNPVETLHSMFLDNPGMNSEAVSALFDADETVRLTLQYARSVLAHNKAKGGNMSVD